MVSSLEGSLVLTKETQETMMFLAKKRLLCARFEHHSVKLTQKQTFRSFFIWKFLVTHVSKKRKFRYLRISHSFFLTSGMKAGI